MTDNMHNADHRTTSGYKLSLMLKRHGFHSSRSLGQNFLTDPGVIAAIIEAAGTGRNDLVIEIGPGAGALTRRIAMRARRVLAIEIDSGLTDMLRETLGGLCNVEIINDDILKTDLNALIGREQATCADEAGGQVRIIGNLPYYITTPIIMALLKGRVKADSITIMVQREVADRIMAAPGTRERGALSVAVQYYCEAERVCEVTREAFLPVPGVDSTVLHFVPRAEAPVALVSEQLFFDVVRAGFGKKRKTLLNSLGSLIPDRAELAGLLDRVGVARERRAETLSLEEFARIANAVAARGTGGTGRTERTRGADR